MTSDGHSDDLPHQVRTAWRRAGGSLFTPGVSLFTPAPPGGSSPGGSSPARPPDSPFTPHNAGAHSHSPEQLGASSHRNGPLFTGRAMARSPELLPQPRSPLLPLPTHWNHAHGGVEMIDAAISARPLEEAAMLQHLLDSAELRKKTEDFAAIQVIATDCL